MTLQEFDFNGQRVLVVGGSSGIGNGIAQAFRQRGAAVHVWGTRPEAADYAGEKGSDLEGLHYACCNVANGAEVDALQPDFDTLDVLVMCQGTVRYDREEFEPGTFREVVEVNLNSLMTCAHKFYPMLKESQGSVVVISSLAGYSARIGNPAYAASKAGAISLTKSLGEAWARDGIRVNGVAPGLVPSKLTGVTFDDPERARKVLRGIPAGRFGTPQDIAGPVLFLASPLASYVVGQTLVVDGGKGLS
ncbi:MAG: short-chain dehydrogenase/reductase [Polaromonas sp.]|jgi:3-oxoacyl-[acyl-carrier protein] reductase|nr:short-chain dehydrogenase/reductase [Polaromonas sp.]